MSPTHFPGQGLAADHPANPLPPSLKTNNHIDSSSQEADFQKKRKREVPVGIQESAKIRRKESKIIDQEVNNVDLISQLSDDIIHHILSFLRCKKDAARISILSKRWRALWASYSILELDQRRFLKKLGKLPSCRKRQVIAKNREREIREKTEMYRNFVDNILGSRIELNCGIKKYSFHLTSYNWKLGMDMDRWLGLVKENGVQELDLCVPSKKNRNYTVPQTIFSTKTITALKIFGCKMDECKGIQLSSLRKLCLGRLYVNDHTMQNLLLNCPLLEDLRLVYCRGLKCLFSSSSKLIRVDLHCCDRLKKIELQAPSLQMFWFHGDKNMACDYHLEMCTSLKSLTLKVARLKDDSFQNLLSSFPVLEHLSLSNCDALRRVTISSHRLKTLALMECKNLKDADIDAPNLLSLEYKGSEIPFLPFNPSGLKEAKLSFFNCDFLFWDQLQNFVGKFDKNMRMIVQSKKNAILHEDLREVLIPRSKILKLEFVKWSMSFEDVVDKLLQLYPEKLTTISSADSDFSKRVYSRMTDREVKPSCCTYNASNNKCWRHYLKDAVTIDNLLSYCNLHDSEETSWIFALESEKSKMKNEFVSYALDWRKGKNKLEENEGCIENDFISLE